MLAKARDFRGVEVNTVRQPDAFVKPPPHVVFSSAPRTAQRLAIRWRTSYSVRAGKTQFGADQHIKDAVSARSTANRRMTRLC
jgi:hypothetical protein